MAVLCLIDILIKSGTIQFFDTVNLDYFHALE